MPRDNGRCPSGSSGGLSEGLDHGKRADSSSSDVHLAAQRTSAKGRSKGGSRSPSSVGVASNPSSDEDTPRLPRPLLLALHSYVKAGRSPSDGVLSLAARGFRQAALGPILRFLSLPASFDNWVLSSSSGTPRKPQLSKGRRLTLSQARLIIPRSISEYLECCRGARSQSEGLLFAASIPEGALYRCRDIVPRALSEGLLGGRLFSGRPPPDGRSSPSAAREGPPPRIPVEDMRKGTCVEGKIVRIARIGFFLDVGATRCALLQRHTCQNVPKVLLRKGEVLSNLVVLHVNREKKQLTVRLKGVGEGGDEIEEEDYDAILHRITHWAGIPLPTPPASEDSATDRSVSKLAGAVAERTEGGRPEGDDEAPQPKKKLPAGDGGAQRPQPLKPGEGGRPEGDGDAAQFRRQLPAGDGAGGGSAQRMQRSQQRAATSHEAVAVPKQPGSSRATAAADGAASASAEAAQSHPSKRRKPRRRGGRGAQGGVSGGAG